MTDNENPTPPPPMPQPPPPAPDHSVARRIRFMRVTGQWFVDLCKGKETRRCRPIAHVLPDDTVFLDAKVSESGLTFMIIESRAFALVPAQSVIPEHPPVQFEVITYRHDLRDGPIAAGPQIDEHAVAGVLEEFETYLDGLAADDNVPNNVVRQLREYHAGFAKVLRAQ